MEYYSAIKKKERLTFATNWEELEDIKCKPYADQCQMFPTEELEAHPKCELLLA